MTSKDRKDVYNTASGAGYKQSAYDVNKQIHSSGSTVTHVGSNRTVIDGITRYGASAAKKALNGQ